MNYKLLHIKHVFDFRITKHINTKGKLHVYHFHASTFYFYLTTKGTFSKIYFSLSDKRLLCFFFIYIINKYLNK